MKIVIVAATGGIGRQLLRQAIDAGYDVTAVVRSPQKLAGLPVRTVAADLAHPDAAALTAAIAGADAVLSGLGARTAADTGVAERGTRAVVDAMRATGVPSPARPGPPKHDPGDGFFMRHLGAPFARTAFRKHYADLARMEDVVRDSDLDWTISRPPKLTDGPLTGAYRTALGHNIRGGFSVSRADVAHQMLRSLDQPETVREIVGLAR